MRPRESPRGWIRGRIVNAGPILGPFAIVRPGRLADRRDWLLRGDDDLKRVSGKLRTVLEKHRRAILEYQGLVSQDGGQLNAVVDDRPGVGRGGAVGGQRPGGGSGRGVEIDGVLVVGRRPQLVPVGAVVPVVNEHETGAATGDHDGGVVVIAAEISVVQQRPQHRAVFLHEDGNAVIGYGFFGHQVGKAVQRPRRYLHRHQQGATAENDGRGPEN